MPRPRPIRKRFIPTDPNLIVVPGVDSSLSPAVQIDMIDQLITAKLASVDENLAKAHQVITNDLLPAVQRFAKVSQPTKEAAQFWRSFFELAAKVRVPTEGEEDFTQTETETETEADTTDTQEEEQTFDGDTTADTITTNNNEPSNARSAANTAAMFLKGIKGGDRQTDPNVTPSEHSFAPFSASTPAREPGSLTTDDLTTNSSAVSWTPPQSVGGSKNPTFDFSTDSAATPVASDRNKGKEVPRFDPFNFDISSTASEASISGPSFPSITDTSGSVASSDYDQRKTAATYKLTGKGKSRASGDALLQTVLKKQATKGGGTPKLSRYNPFLPAGTKQPWDGLVNLSASPSLSTGDTSSLPDFAKFDLSSSSASSSVDRGSPSRSCLQDRLPTAGGSTSDGRPLLDWSNTNSSIRFPEPHPDLVKLVATPSKKAAKLIVQDLLMGMDLNLLEDSPEMPAPPSIQRLHAHLQGMPAQPRLSLLEAMKNPLLKDDDDDSDGDGNGDLYDSDSDGDDDAHMYAPSAAPGSGGYQHHHQQEEGNDSFDSDASFNAAAEDDDSSTPGAHNHHNNNQFDDMTDFGMGNEDTDTLFGIRGNPAPPAQGFRLENDNSMHTFMGGRLEDAVPFQPSPTPYTGAYEPLDRRLQGPSRGR
ncbi:DASH complex subunit ask1 [Tulasnella sp. 330]|nr:DASH complex subunit ask1 [Tulasnella sp. 330]KAG8877775.1 DASH complex subunit ask1 [Tulasnella sp. 332]